LDAQAAPKVLRFMDALEDLEDVQRIWSNFDIPDDVMATLAE
jgi:transcriptional/translational regulatory protein YebC/TACO1